MYKAVPELVRRRDSTSDEINRQTESTTEGVLQRAVTYVKSAIEPWREYAASPVFLPSFALSILYLTVLSFGAQMVTYLLHTGFNSLEVSCMRIGAVVAELAGTWTAPWAMNKIGPVRSGLWFINYQLGCLAASAAAFLFLDPSSRLVALCLILGVALSRLGLWGFDLSVQFLVQEVCHKPFHQLRPVSNPFVFFRTPMRAHGHDFPQQRWPFRMSSSFCLSHPRLRFLSQSSLSIQYLSATVRLPQQLYVSLST